MKSYLEENNLHYFTFSPNSYLTCQLKDISNNIENLGFNVRQMTATRRAPTGKTHVETLPLFLDALTKNMKSQEIFKLNSLNHITIKAEFYRAQIGLSSATTTNTLAMSGPTASNSFNVCGAMVAT
jgi:hypothetical protein